MSIVLIPTKRGYRYTCDCGDPDIMIDRGEGYYCYSCDSWRAWATKEEIQQLREVAQ